MTTVPGHNFGQVQETLTGRFSSEASMMAFLLHGLAAAFLSAFAPDVCALLTKAEAEAILGKAIAPPQKRGISECHYETEPGNADILIAVLPLAFKSKEEFHAFLVKDTEATNARIKESLKKTGATPKETAVEPVSEVGVPAYYVDPSLVVLKNTRVLSIVAADRKQAIAVAAKAVPRFE
jgi:hypothetical protein